MEDPENSLALFYSEHDLENCNPDSHAQIKHFAGAAAATPLPLNGESQPATRLLLTRVREGTPRNDKLQSGLFKNVHKKKTTKKNKPEL